MNNAIFPSGLSLIKNNINIEALKEFAQGWDIEYMQMQQGEVNLSFEVIHTPKIQLAFESYEKGVLIKGKYPENAVVLAVVKSNGKANFKQNLLQDNELVVAHSNEELDFLSFNSSVIFTISVEENLFYNTFYSYFSNHGLSLIKKKQVFIKNELLEDFKSYILKWITYLRKNEMNSTAYPELEVKILHDIFSTIVIKKEAQKRAKFDISKVRKELDENLQNNISIPDINSKCKISERQLHNAFKSNYGYTPKQYVNNLRLNAIRKELLSQSKTSISTIAIKYKYIHMGHFSKEYKKMFSETPSQTRKSLLKKLN